MSKKLYIQKSGNPVYLREIIYEDDDSILYQYVRVLPGKVDEYGWVTNKRRVVEKKEIFYEKFEVYTPPPVKVTKYCNMYEGAKGRRIVGSHLADSPEELLKYNSNNGVEYSLGTATITWEEPAGE